MIVEEKIAKTAEKFGVAMMQRYIDECQPPMHLATTDLVWHVSRFDPTTKKAFVRHLARWYADGSMKRLEDASKAQEPLALYEKYRNRDLPALDSLSFSQLLDLGDSLREAESRSEANKGAEDRFFKNGDAELIIDNDDFKIVVPKTEEASNFFGRNTRWCTAMREDNRFDEYNVSSPLYIVIFKGRGTAKWQFHFTTLQFMDEADDDLVAEDAMAFCPAVFDFFRDQFIQHGRLDFVSDPDDLPHDQKINALTRYGSNIVLFKNQTLDMAKIALKAGMVNWCDINETLRSDTSLRKEAIAPGRNLDRFFQFENPDNETTAYFHARIAEELVRLDKPTSPRVDDVIAFMDDLMGYSRRFPWRKTAQYIIDNKMTDNKEYLKALENVVSRKSWTHLMHDMIHIARPTGLFGRIINNI